MKLRPLMKDVGWQECKRDFWQNRSPNYTILQKGYIRNAPLKKWMEKETKKRNRLVVVDSGVSGVQAHLCQQSGAVRISQTLVQVQ